MQISFLSFNFKLEWWHFLFFGYIFLFVNRIVYLTRDYFLKKEKLNKRERQEIGLVKARHGQSSGLGYSSILEGNIANLEYDYSTQLKELRIKYQYDLISSLINCVLDPFLRKI